MKTRINSLRSVFRWSRLTGVFYAVVITLAALELRAGDRVPLKAEWTGQLVSSVPTADGGFDQVALHTGKGSHVGKASELIEQHVTFEVTAEALVVHFAGTATITAANGDLVFATFEAEEIVPHGASPPYEFTVDWEITGGTGRFAGATGSGTSTGLDHGNGQVSHTDVGVISTVGSNKK